MSQPHVGSPRGLASGAVEHTNVEDTLHAEPILIWAALAVGLVFVLFRMILKWRGRVGPYCVAVWESGGSTSQESFHSFNDARSYADDAASEEEEPIAKVFNARGEVVYRGRHYASRYRPQLPWW